MVHPDIEATRKYLADQRRSLDDLTAEVASAKPRTDNPSMEFVPRPELDAKLDAMEARMDTRVARIEGKLDLVVERLQATQQGVSNLRWWLLGAALSVLLACIGTGIAIQQMTVTTFQAAGQQPIVIQVPQNMNPSPPAQPSK